MSKHFIEDYSAIHDHVETITDHELDMLILKVGALASIIQNKKINQTKLLLMAVEDEAFKKCFLSIVELDNFRQLVSCMIEKFPTICDSKSIYSALKRNDKARRKHI